MKGSVGEGLWVGMWGWVVGVGVTGEWEECWCGDGQKSSAPPAVSSGFSEFRVLWPLPPCHEVPPSGCQSQDAHPVHRLLESSCPCRSFQSSQNMKASLFFFLQILYISS